MDKASGLNCYYHCPLTVHLSPSLCVSMFTSCCALFYGRTFTTSHENENKHLNITVCTWYRVVIWAKRMVSFTYSLLTLGYVTKTPLLMLSADTCTNCGLDVPRNSSLVSRWCLVPWHDWEHFPELSDHP